LLAQHVGPNSYGRFGTVSRDSAGLSYSGSSPMLPSFAGSSDELAAVSSGMQHGGLGQSALGSRGNLNALPGLNLPPQQHASGTHFPPPGGYHHGSGGGGGRPPISGHTGIPGHGGPGHSFAFDRTVSTPQLHMLQQQQQQQHQQLQQFTGRRSPRANGGGMQGLGIGAAGNGGRGLYGVQSEQNLASLRSSAYPGVGGMSSEQVLETGLYFLLLRLLMTLMH